MPEKAPDGTPMADQIVEFANRLAEYAEEMKHQVEHVVTDDHPDCLPHCDGIGHLNRIGELLGEINMSSGMSAMVFYGYLEKIKMTDPHERARRAGGAGLN